MSNPIEAVEEWLETRDDLDSPSLIPLDELALLVEHAKKSDDHVRKMYQIIGFMFKDACTAMSQGQAKTYKALTVDEVFERVQEELGLPVPLDMAPSMEEIPEAANDLPRIHLIN